MNNGNRFGGDQQYAHLVEHGFFRGQLDLASAVLPNPTSPELSHGRAAKIASRPGHRRPFAVTRAPSDIPDVDEQFPAVGQHDAQRVNDPFWQVKLAKYFDVDDLGVGDQEAAQHAAGVIGRGRLALGGVIHGRHAAFDRRGLAAELRIRTHFLR
jgi:hypothetical protein